MNQTQSSSSSPIRSTNAENFQADVFELSNATPVVVDFWAPWCQPCRMLTPILEGLAEEFGGRFVLVKANTDELPEQAATFQVGGIPAVYGVRKGEIVDLFQGLLPEGAIREWLERLIPSQAQRLVDEAAKLAEQDPAAAEAKLLEALSQDERLDPARLALGQVYAQRGNWDGCQEIVEQLESRGFLEPEAEALRAALHRQMQATEAGDVADCEAAVAGDPHDPRLRLRLAQALAGQNEHEKALQAALQVVEQDRGPQREAARELMVDIFRLLPDDSELTRNFRRRLSAALF